MNLSRRSISVAFQNRSPLPITLVVDKKKTTAPMLHFENSIWSRDVNVDIQNFALYFSVFFVRLSGYRSVSSLVSMFGWRLFQFHHHMAVSCLSLSEKAKVVGYVCWLSRSHYLTYFELLWWGEVRERSCEERGRENKCNYMMRKIIAKGRHLIAAYNVI